MSEREDRMEFVGLRLDPTAVGPWGARVGTPAEEAMRHEEQEGADEEVDRTHVLRVLLGCVFSDAGRMGWVGPGLRCLAVMERNFPSMLVGRHLKEVRWLRDGVWAEQMAVGFSPGMLREALSDGELVMCGELLGKMFRKQGRRWFREGMRMMYLLAKSWLPMLLSDEELSRDRLRWVSHEMSYEGLARAFGELGASPTDRERNLARSRWCAIKKRLIEEPVKERGGKIHLGFSKGDETRQRCAEAARRTRNRGRKE